MLKKTELEVKSPSFVLTSIMRDCINLEQLTFPLWFYFFLCTQTKLLSQNSSELSQKYTIWHSFIVQVEPSEPSQPKANTLV